MADIEKEKTKGEEVHEDIQRIRMTLRSKEVKPLESACAEIVARAKNQGYDTKGPVRIPTKILKITTRKSPCGEGSKTWDRFEMRIHKRVIDIHCPSSVVKEITNFRIDPGVDVNLIVNGATSSLSGSRPPIGMGPRAGGGQPMSSQDMSRFLPQISDPNRQVLRENLLETIQKDIHPSMLEKVIEQNSGNISSSGDRGENSAEMNPIDIIVQLETLIYSKYPDSNGGNYKGLSKRIVQSLKSNADQRLQLLESKDQTQIEDFLQSFLFNKPSKGQQAQEGAGGASGNQSNPFAFPQARPAGGPPQAKRPTGPQARLPQQRFAAGNFFQTAPTQSAISGAQQQYTAPAINIGEQQQQLQQYQESNQTKETQSSSNNNNNNQNTSPFLASSATSSVANAFQASEDPQSQFYEQERPPVQNPDRQHLKQLSNQQFEDVKQQFPSSQSQQKDTVIHHDIIPNINFSDSGAADVSMINFNQSQNQNLQKKSNNKQENVAVGGAPQIFGDEFDFFQSLADNAVKQQQQQQQQLQNQAHINQNSSLTFDDQQQYQQPIRKQIHEIEEVKEQEQQQQQNQQQQQQQYYGFSGQSEEQQTFPNNQELSYGLPQQQYTQAQRADNQMSTHMNQYPHATRQQDNAYSLQEEQSRGDLSMEGQRLEFEDDHTNNDQQLQLHNYQQHYQQYLNQEQEQIKEDTGVRLSSNQNESHFENEESGRNHGQSSENNRHQVLEGQRMNEVYQPEEEGLNIEEGKVIEQCREEESKSNNNNYFIEGDQAAQQRVQQILDSNEKSERFNEPQYEKFQFNNSNEQLRSQSREGFSTTKLQTQESDQKLMPRNASQSLMIGPNNLPMQTPSMKGFIQSYQSSRPPQSVASVNITNLEDSEGLIRAYKKKKAEHEELKENFYRIETDFFTEKQKNLLQEEDIGRLRASLNRAEKLLKEVQLKQSRQDSDLLTKQLQLKNQEASAYQSELQNQKQENAKLREKIKELMNRGRSATGNSPQVFSSNADNNQLQEQLLRTVKQNDDLNSQLDNLRQQMNQQLLQNQEKIRKIENDKNEIVAKLEKQVINLKQAATSGHHQQETWIAKLHYEKTQLEQELAQKNQLIESLKKQLEEVQQKQKSSQKSHQEEESSFVNIQNENQTPSEEQYFAGYYDSNNISIHSEKSSAGNASRGVKSNIQQQQQQLQNTEYPVMSSYFGDQSEKQSSAPPSQTKQQQIAKNQNQIFANNPSPQSHQERLYNQQPQLQKNVSSTSGSKANTSQSVQSASVLKEAEDFFSSLPQKQNQQLQPRVQQPQQKSQQQQNPQQIPTYQQRQPQQQMPPQMLQQPVQKQAATVLQQQQLKPPRPGQANNIYNFTLDDISFDQSFTQQPVSQLPQEQTQVKPPQWQNQQQNPQLVQKPLPQQPQQRPTQLQQQQQQVRLNPQANLGSQQSQTKPSSNLYADFDFNSTTTPSVGSSGNQANIIPKSLFD